MKVSRATKTIYIEISFPKIAHDSRIRSAYNIIYFAMRKRERERERERENSQISFYKDCCLESVKNKCTLIDRYIYIYMGVTHLGRFLAVELPLT